VNPSYVPHESIAYRLNGVHLLAAFKAVADPHTMHLHEASRRSDFPQFIKAAEKEVNDHTNNELCEVVPRKKKPVLLGGKAVN
jgi:hypothetical protein